MKRTRQCTRTRMHETLSVAFDFPTRSNHDCICNIYINHFWCSDISQFCSNADPPIRWHPRASAHWWKLSFYVISSIKFVLFSQFAEFIWIDIKHWQFFDKRTPVHLMSPQLSAFSWNHFHMSKNHSNWWRTNASYFSAIEKKAQREFSIIFINMEWTNLWNKNGSLSFLKSNRLKERQRRDR